MKIEENVPMAPYTTLKIGGPARYFVQASSQEDLRAALRFAGENELPVFVLGGGSNLLVADAGYAGLVVQLTGRGRALPQAARDTAKPYLDFGVDADMDWDAFVLSTCEQGLSGVECLAGIPGTVGASPVQNIGAYGQEVSQTIQSVLAFDREGMTAILLPASDCGFGYRSSIFNSTMKDRYIVFEVFFRLSKTAHPKLTYPDLQRHFAGRLEPSPLEIYHAVREIRAAKGMLIDPANPTADSTSAGSFFKNPVVPMHVLDGIAARLGIRVGEIKHWPVSAHPEASDLGGTVPGGVGATKLPAAWLIEKAGFAKGYTRGAVGISTKHTLALTNRTGAATCAELLGLRDEIVDGVRKAFGVVLEQEPVLLG